MEEKKSEVVQLTMEQLQAMISNGIGEATKALGMDKVDRKHGVFPGQEEDLDKTTKEERLRTWLKSVLFKRPDDLAKVKATMSWATTVGLGFAPEEFRTEVIRVMESYGWVRRYAYVFPTSVAKVNLHQANGVLTAYWITDQTSAITETNPTFTEPAIDIEKVATLSAVANELLEDATFPIISYVAELAGEALAYAEDYQACQGSGSPYHGIFGTQSGQASVTSSSGSYAGFSADELLDLAMSVSAKYRKGAMYIMHPTVLGALTKSFKASGSGEYILRTPREDGLATSIWGYNVIESEAMPSTDAVATKFIGFANPKRLFVADRRQMIVATSQDAALTTAGNLFEKDLTGIKVTQRVGLGWTLPAGTAHLKTAAA